MAATTFVNIEMAPESPNREVMSPSSMPLSTMAGVIVTTVTVDAEAEYAFRHSAAIMLLDALEFLQVTVSAEYSSQ